MTLKWETKRLQVLARLRQSSRVPVIVLSARSDDDDKLSTLRMGADDYVTKPFNPKEIVARVAAVLRRMQLTDRAVLRLGNLELNLTARRADVDGLLVDLTDSEYRLLELMLRQPGRAFSRADLLDAGLQDSNALERTIDSHVSNLRRKLTASGAAVALISLRGFGYRMDPL